MHLRIPTREQLSDAMCAQQSWILQREHKLVLKSMVIVLYLIKTGSVFKLSHEKT